MKRGREQSRAEQVEGTLHMIIRDLRECRLTVDDLQNIKQQLCGINAYIFDCSVKELDNSVEEADQAIISELLNMAHELSTALLVELTESEGSDDVEN
ncbi:hypothetical protein BCR33DRAFT_714569 [Rhizoclosmatium globosum]|uniref:Uncharacterized protein n=1 Tax=Rhizoclosmatium globosum TaxID=329046 RepID=A0A1Y2CMB0_9FUNG|nr:hypothetical protein BCR33DRAFT_714569 [Rhizoclosmatium globosum]|eukprot:ORY48150.1 hypothetical protein BCR33DRAFT_714569 [Rhizoclosmatium globosum]